MRITSLTLNGFRAFAGECRFDLDADVVVVVGPNGQGKTSLFDGVLWALTGNVPRLGESDRPLVSMFSESGQAEVSLEMSSDDGLPLTVTRRFDGERQHLRVEVEEKDLRGEAAVAALLEKLWPDALSTPDGATALAAALRRSIYLEQDRVRQFVEADSASERFDAVSELVGAGRVSDLQAQLDRSKRSWVRATNVRKEEAADLVQRIVATRDRLDRLQDSSEAPTPDIEGRWNRWWEDAQVCLDSLPTPPQRLSADAPGAIESAIRQLAAMVQSGRRSIETARALLSDLGDQSGSEPPPDVSSVQAEYAAAETVVETARTALTEAEASAAEVRRIQTETRDAEQELQALASLALRHLGERCPVCTQEYDIDVARENLQAHLTGEPSDAADAVAAQRVASASAARREAETSLAGLREAVEKARSEARHHSEVWADRSQRLRDLGLDAAIGEEASSSVTALIDQLERESAAAAALRRKGEALSLEIARGAERPLAAELGRELGGLQKEEADLNAWLIARKRTADAAGEILEDLREATVDVVGKELERIGVLLQRIYSRIDPHPAFRTVRFITSLFGGRGRLGTTLDDTALRISAEEPHLVFSSSQLNALAASVFLSFNLGIDTLPLKTAMLDDPLQSLDDVNLLGLIDLLRRTRDSRQLIVSTHDRRFGNLLERKLRPLNAQAKTLVISFDGWDRSGPEVSQRDGVRGNPDLRMVV